MRHSAEMANMSQAELTANWQRYLAGSQKQSDPPLTDQQRAEKEAERAREFAQAMIATQDRLMSAMGIPVESRPYLTGNWAVSPPPTLSGGFPLTSLTIDEADRYPHTCPRCQGPAYVGAVEVDCAGGCK